MNSTYASVIGIVHLHSNQGVPKYLYKKVEVCIQVSSIRMHANYETCRECMQVTVSRKTLKWM